MKTASRPSRKNQYQAGFRNTGWTSDGNLQEVLSLPERLKKTAPSARMTPFLGAACSSAGGDLEPRAAQRDAILERIARLREPVPQEDDFAALTEQELSYARAVCAKYGAKPPKKTAPVATALPPADPPLTAFQRELIRFATLAERLAGKSLQQRPVGVTDLRNTWLVIDDDEHASLRAQLDQLLGRAYRLWSSDRESGGRSSTLGARGILEQIRVLALEVLPETHRLRPETGELLRLEEDKLREVYTPRFMRFPPKDAFQLALSHVEWLSALLWHTLRHDARFFPGSSELAFQLSLYSSQVPPLRAELGQAAEVTIAGSGEGMARRLNEWFEYYADEAAVRPGTLHLAIAAYLVYAARLRKLHAGRSRQSDIWPVALTTNYDCELERAFRITRQQFRVLIPASARIDGRDTQPKDVWVCHSIRWAGDRDYLDTTILDPALMDANPLENDRLELLMQLPVIVKLHGTIGYTLPPKVSVKRKDGSCTTYSRIHYDMVLRESDYLASMARFPTDLLLQTLEDRLFERNDPNEIKRLVCFLGHSLSDWNIRLRVYERVHRFHSPERRAEVVAVNRRIDRYRAQIFAPLECEVASTDLSTFVDGLCGTDGVDEIFTDFCKVVHP